MDKDKQIVPSQDAILKQYELLQSRINVHGTRMWQLPFSYLGILGVIISFIDSELKQANEIWVFVGLIILGLLLLWALIGAYRRYVQTAKNMNKLEESLGLQTYTVVLSAHYYPYFLMIFLGMVASTFMLF